LISDELAGPASDRRNRDRNRDHLPVQVAPRPLERFDPLSQLQPAQNIRFLIPFVVGYDQIERLSDRFAFRIAEHTFGSLIPAYDCAGMILAHDGVEGRLDDGCEASALCSSVLNRLAYFCSVDMI